MVSLSIADGTQRVATNMKMHAVCFDMKDAAPEFVEREAARIGTELENEIRAKAADAEFWKNFAKSLLEQVRAYDESSKR